MLFSSMDELKSDKLESSFLETLDDLADKSPLDTIGLMTVSTQRDLITVA